MDRRSMLNTTAAMAAGAVAGCALPGTAAQGTKTPFTVPENVGPVVRGDVIECHIDGLPDLSVRIV